MAHKLIVGQTLSGKSTLARAMVKDAISRGIQPCIYDPTMNPDWGTEFVTCEPDIFFAWLRDFHAAGYKCVAVIDEAETILSQSDRRNWWLFTRGRHFAIECIAITLRPTLIAPTVRGNCAELFCFYINRNDAAILASDFGAPAVEKAYELIQGEFFRAAWKDKKKCVDKLKIF